MKELYEAKSKEARVQREKSIDLQRKLKKFTKVQRIMSKGQRDKDRENGESEDD